MGLKDTDLEKELTIKLAELERLNDSVGPSPVRNLISAYIVKCRLVLRDFDQALYDSAEGDRYAGVWQNHAVNVSYEQWTLPRSNPPEGLPCEECGKRVTEENAVLYGNYLFCSSECCVRFVGC